VNSVYLFNRLHNRKKDKTRIIPNFYPRAIEKLAYNQQEKPKYILSISNGFGKRKNIDTALKAFALVRKQYSNIEYHLIGDGMEPYGSAYQFAKENNITGGIKFLGKLPFKEVIKKMQSAIIFLHPSREESFGMAVLESMVIGTPVIGGENSGNIPYLLENGKAGFLCNINSVKDISKGIIKLLVDRNYARMLTETARQLACQRYSEDGVVSKYLEYFEHILS
jgi:L-malate glycosyltransferase